jgi:hypothetical protein
MEKSFRIQYGECAYHVPERVAIFSWELEEQVRQFRWLLVVSSSFMESNEFIWKQERDDECQGESRA